MSAARWASSVLAAFLLATAGNAIPAMAEVEPGTQEGASVLKAGWWWRANENPAGDTDVNPGNPTAPNVPEGTLPVASTVGQPDKIAAIEFAFDADPGATVTSLQLSLTESEETGATYNTDADDAVIFACQITDAFWVDGAGESWSTRPEYADEGCVPGERDDDGVWQFDLTSLAAGWTVGDVDVPSAVVLATDPASEPDPDPEKRQTLQAAFEDPLGDDIGLTAVTEGGGPVDDAAPAAPAGADAGTAGGGGFVDSGTPASGGDVSSGSSGGDSVPTEADVPSDEADGAAEETDSGVTDADLVASPGPTKPGLFDGIPPAVWILIPVVAGLAYVLMLAMGPSGAQAGGATRRGVSRALERLRSGTAAKGAA